MADYQYTYRLQIDLGHGGSFTHYLADFTKRWRDESTLSIGFTDPFGEVAPPSRLRFRLHNGDRKLTPDNTTSPYYGLLTRGTLVKITASFNGTTYITWIGKIAKITPYLDPNQANNQYIEVAAEDFMNQLLDAQIFPALMTDVLIHTALAAVLDEASSSVIYPYPSSWSVLDVSALDTAKLLSQDLFTYSVSGVTLPYVGDNASDRNNTVSARSMIGDLVSAECGGRFFWNGQKFEFQDRYFIINTVLGAPALTLYGEDIQAGEFRYGDDLQNDVTANYQPRALGTPASIIYSSDRVISVAAGQVRTINAQYRDSVTQNLRIGALDVIELVAGTDFVANSSDDGTGTNLTAFISASLQISAQSTTIALYNTGSDTAHITTLQVRGTPLYTYERASANAVDAQSIYDNGRYPRSYTFKLIADDETAQGFANIQVARFAAQFMRFNTVTFIANGAIKLIQSTVTIGQTVLISEPTATKHLREYAVVGIQHRMNAATRIHYTTYTLSPIARETYWTLGVAGYSELGSTAVIGL